jgi:hypothetical protein
MSPYRRYARRYSNTVAFVVLAVSVFVSVAVSSHQQHDALTKVCESNTEVRQAMRSLVNVRAAGPITVPPGADDALARAITEANERNAEVRRSVEEIFADPPCTAALK